MRDLRNVGGKLKVVLMPSEKQEGVLQKLRDCACSRNLANWECFVNA
jgi:hypothetical protein